MGWSAGLNNLITDTSTPHTGKGFIALGFNNEVRPGTSENYIVTIGNANEGYGANNFIFGRSNTGSSNTVMTGFGLKKITSGGSNNNSCLYGTYNSTTSGLNGTVVAIGVGVSNIDRKNAMVMSKDVVKITNNLELNSDHTQVNAIDAPADPANPTSDEQTLATLGSLHNLGIMRQEQHYFTTLPNLAGGTQNITNDLGLTVPAWATEIIVHMKIVDATNFNTPVTRRCNVSIPVQPADISTTWRGYLNIMHIAIQNSIYTTVYYAGEIYIYQNVLGLEKATELKLVEATPPTVGFVRSSSSFFVEGMEFKGIY